MIISKEKKWNRRENDGRTSSFCRNGRIDFGEALDDGEDSFDELVFASRRSHSFPVAWKWERRRLEIPKTIRDLFISQTLSLSKKSEWKSKELEVGTYILLEIDWSEQWRVEPWSENKVWCENLSMKRYFNFGGFDDLGVLKIWGFWTL